MLRKAGAIVLRDYYGPDHVEEAYDCAAELAARLGGWYDRDPREFKFGGAVLRNRLHRPRGGYGSIAALGQPVINVREGLDDRLVDVFRPEMLWPQQSLWNDGARESLVSSLVQQAFGPTPVTKIRNLYINEGVTRTRGFHVDGVAFKVKAFLYLTPVRSLDDGPYCYAVGSHRARLLQSVNRFMNQHEGRQLTDFPRLGGTPVATFLGEPGDLIISAQYGAHRGWPQSHSARRVVAVQMLMAKGARMGQLKDAAKNQGQRSRARTR